MSNSNLGLPARVLCVGPDMAKLLDVETDMDVGVEKAAATRPGRTGSRKAVHGCTEALIDLTRGEGGRTRGSGICEVRSQVSDDDGIGQ